MEVKTFRIKPRCKVLSLSLHGNGSSFWPVRMHHTYTHSRHVRMHGQRQTHACMHTAWRTRLLSGCNHHRGVGWTLFAPGGIFRCYFNPHLPLWLDGTDLAIFCGLHQHAVSLPDTRSSIYSSLTWKRFKALNGLHYLKGGKVPIAALS